MRVTLKQYIETCKGHPWKRNCPVCGEDCSTAALVDLVYAFEECECDAVTYKHLVETVHHRTCFLTKTADREG